MGNSHIIHKQVLEISTDSVKAAQEIESRYNELIKQVNTPSFERCFEGLLSPHQHLLIERLEIDLGVFKKEALFRELGTCLSMALKEALQQKIAIYPPPISPEKNETQNIGLENASIGNATGKSSSSLSLLEGPFDVFVFFLEKGRLPNWIPEMFILEDNCIEALDSNQKTKLKNLFFGSEQAQLRLVAAFSVRFITKLLGYFGPIERIFENWRWIDRHLAHPEADKTLFRQYYWLHAIPVVLHSGQDRGNSVMDYEMEIIHKTLVKLRDILVVSIKKLLKEKYIPESLQKSLRISMETIIAENKIENIETLKNKTWVITPSPFEDPAFLRKPSSEESPGIKTGPEWNTEKNPGKVISIRDELLANEEPILVNDAGLVILSPFITELFRSCDFLDKGLFKSIEMNARAVNILVYLAHGNEELPEYKKLLPKLLCGFLWETALPDGLPLTNQEKEQADELLKAVVNHWKALRNSSAEAVQEAFIRRNGKLFPGNQGIILEVEKKTQDVLLSHLPWGFSTIKLQWMSHILHVSWT